MYGLDDEEHRARCVLFLLSNFPIAQAEEYILKAEHQGGSSYWDYFSNMIELNDDFCAYFENRSV